MNQHRHLVFYDGECGLCDQVVQLVFKLDKQHLFDFAPLQGQTAARYLQSLPPHLKSVDSIILIQDYQTGCSQLFILSTAVFRIFWLIGGWGVLMGWLSFLPSFLFDWAYRFIARYRHRFFSKTHCFIPPPYQKDRFLD
jgi:predicted DCC family thiol-disulfide oxidoreductase YuxK